MSYKKKKLKKSRLSRLKFRLEQIGRALLGRTTALLQWRRKMRMRQVQRIMKGLRLLNMSGNSKNIDEWADQYIDECILNGQPVQILTQWCIAKDLEERLKAQGGEFTAVNAEQELILKTIPRIVLLFESNGVAIDWWITLNRSFIDTGRISSEVEQKYKAMLGALIQDSDASKSIVLIDWEDEILNGRPKAAPEVQKNISKYVSPEAFEVDFVRHAAWVRDDTGTILSDAEIRQDLEFKIACEAEEGRFLMSPESPFPNGQFLLATLELSERYVFFSILAPDFQKRLLAVLKPNPWRLNP